MAGEKRHRNIPADTVLTYKAGEHIIKAGDYGVSIYRIRKGKVLIYLESKAGDISIAELDAGEIFGEMAFLRGSVSMRNASAKALEFTELDVWHPLSLREEYDRMPYILKFILNQSFHRLLKINDYIVKLEEQIEKNRCPIPYFTDQSRRKYFRQPVDLDCSFQPITKRKKKRNWAKVEDLSKGGARLNVNRMDLVGIDLSAGDQFNLEIFLNPERRIAAMAEMAFHKFISSQNRCIMGMAFKEMERDHRDALLFYLR
jgi:CRP-like cAMP-binding protein